MPLSRLDRTLKGDEISTIYIDLLHDVVRENHDSNLQICLLYIYYVYVLSPCFSRF